MRRGNASERLNSSTVFLRRCVGALTSDWVQEDQVLHQRKYRRRQSGITRKRNAHHILLDHAAAAIAGAVAVHDQRAAEWDVWIAARPRFRCDAPLDVRPPRSGHCHWGETPISQ